MSSREEAGRLADDPDENRLWVQTTCVGITVKDTTLFSFSSLYLQLAFS